MDDANVYVTKGGYRLCRECQRESARRGYHRRSTYSVAERARKPVVALTADQSRQLAEHVRLVTWCAVRMRKQLDLSWSEHEDMTQDGMIGLASACQTYTEAVGCAFATYAVPRIRTAIRDGLDLRSGRGKGYMWAGLDRLDADDREDAAARQVAARGPTPEDVALSKEDMEMVAAWVGGDAYDETDSLLISGMFAGLKGDRLAAHAGVSKATAHRRSIALRQRLTDRMLGQAS